MRRTWRRISPPIRGRTISCSTTCSSICCARARSLTRRTSSAHARPECGSCRCRPPTARRPARAPRTTACPCRSPASSSTCARAEPCRSPSTPTAIRSMWAENTDTSLPHSASRLQSETADAVGEAVTAPRRTVKPITSMNGMPTEAGPISTVASCSADITIPTPTPPVAPRRSEPLGVWARQLHHGEWRITREGKGEFLLHPPGGEPAVPLRTRAALTAAWAGIDPPPRRFRPAVA